MDENINVQYYLLRANMAHREYSQQEYHGMFEALILSEYDTQIAVQLYRQNNLDLNRYPDYRVIRRLRERMQKVGCLVPNHQYGGRYARVDQELENLVIAAFTDNMNLSTKVCALRLGTHHVMIHRILRFYGYNPYRYQKVQASGTR